MTMRVGLVGVGTMGRGLARNIAKAGHELWVFDRNRATADALVEYGAKPAESLTDLAEHCEVLLACLPSVAAIRSVFLEAGGLIELAQPGTTLVDLSTGDPVLGRECERRAAERGLTFLDVPMLRNPEAAWNGTLHLIAGGDPSALERVRPVLGAVSERIDHVGAAGAGQVLKLLNNAVTISNTAILCEAFTVAKAQGVEPALLAEILGSSMAGSKVLPSVAKRMISDDHSPLFATEVVKKDMTLYAALAAQAGSMSPLGDTVRDLLRLACGLGYGADHYTRIATVLGLPNASHAKE